jgi:plasmid stabilization system protein ParE
VSAPIRIAEPASAEFQEAVRWYESKRTGLGREFFDAIAATITDIQARPDSGNAPFPDRNTRRFIVSRFPYQVVYRTGRKEILILAIAHLKRRPGHWKHRS